MKGSFLLHSKDGIKELLSQIESLFGTKFSDTDNSYSLNISNKKNNSKIHLEVIPDNDKNGKENVFLISVYTNNCHLQLQNSTRFVISNMLEEVIFISETGDKLSGLIISKQGDCALYSNVDKKLLKQDFTDLNSEKLLSAVALSVTESM